MSNVLLQLGHPRNTYDQIVLRSACIDYTVYSISLKNMDRASFCTLGQCLYEQMGLMGMFA